MIDNFTSGKHANIAQFGARVEVFEGYTQREDCRRACRASRSSSIWRHANLPRRSPTRSPRTDQRDGTFNLRWPLATPSAAACQFASSTPTQSPPTCPKRETACPKPLALSVHKPSRAVLPRLHLFVTVGDHRPPLFQCLRPASGPNSEYAAAIRFRQRRAPQRAATVYGDGEQNPDFTFVDNVVHATCWPPRPPVPPAESITSLAASVCPTTRSSGDQRLLGAI